MRYLYTFLVAGSVLLAGVGHPAHAQDGGIYRALTATDVSEVLVSEGFMAEISTDNYGDPLIFSLLDDRQFLIQFYNCDQETRQKCEEIQFSMQWISTALISAGMINEWNKRMRFGNAHLNDDGDPVLTMDLNAIGTSDVQLRDALIWWRTMVYEFEDFLRAEDLIF